MSQIVCLRPMNFSSSKTFFLSTIFESFVSIFWIESVEIPNAWAALKERKKMMFWV